MRRRSFCSPGSIRSAPSPERTTNPPASVQYPKGVRPERGFPSRASCASAAVVRSEITSRSQAAMLASRFRNSRPLAEHLRDGATAETDGASADEAAESLAS